MYDGRGRWVRDGVETGVEAVRDVGDKWYSPESRHESRTLRDHSNNSDNSQDRDEHPGRADALYGSTENEDWHVLGHGTDKRAELEPEDRTE